ncbi:MAG: S8 family serine peptidase [Rhodothermales bacterium]|nr:S8 family serine peptidase [Rhodothermales bacterium]
MKFYTGSTSFSVLFLCLALSAGVLAGCDTIETEPAATGERAAPASKMRHAHLFGAPGSGKVLERFEEFSAHTEFVMGFSFTGQLDPLKVLERYDQEDGVSVKRLFRKSVKGLAVHIDADRLEYILGLVEVDDDIAWMEPDPKYTHGLSGKTFKVPNTQQLVSSLNFVNAHKTSTNPGDGKGAVSVDLYILDTGIEHEDLNVVERVDFSAAGQDVDLTKVLERHETTLDPAGDALGHGTHVAGIAAAIDDADYLVGAAPGARLHDFKVFGKTGQADMSSVIAALDVITARKLFRPLKPIVVNLSLGADIGTTEYNALDEAVAEAVAAGVVVVVAAGNDGIDAATVTPAHVAEAITVGAARRVGVKGKTYNERSSFSNVGSVIDLFAHGEDVQSLSPDPTLTADMSGTSMAAPLVAGVAALYLSKHPLATPSQVRQALLKAADANVVGIPTGTPNRYLNASTF